MKMEVEKQHYQPLVFLGGRFSKAQENCTMCQKEAFVVVNDFEKMDYVFWGPNRIKINTAHRNLLYVFAPLAFRPNTSWYVVVKVHRWKIHLSRLYFVIEHIWGVKNVFADLHTGWSRGDRVRKAASGINTALNQSIVPGTMESKNVTMNEMKAHKNHTPPRGTVMNSDEIWEINSSIWIPGAADDIKTKILIAVHSENNGHRGKSSWRA